VWKKTNRRKAETKMKKIGKVGTKEWCNAKAVLKVKGKARGNRADNDI